MKLGIMQPYFFPYLGYFQLIHAVDEFIVYDNIEYTKKGWINRNRILQNGKDVYITLPLKSDSDYLDIKNRSLADSWEADREKMLNKIKESYKKSPYFESTITVIKNCLMYESKNLFDFLYYSLQVICHHLGINTPLLVYGTIPVDHTLKAEQKVIALCKARNANIYINPIGGMEMYDRVFFAEHGVELKFLKMNEIKYNQTTIEFIPHLSIIDVLMYNSVDEIHNRYLNSFELL